jgi:hypothetical protein
VNADWEKRKKRDFGFLIEDFRLARVDSLRLLDLLFFREIPHGALPIADIAMILTDRAPPDDFLCFRCQISFDRSGARFMAGTPATANLCLFWRNDPWIGNHVHYRGHMFGYLTARPFTRTKSSFFIQKECEIYNPGITHSKIPILLSLEVKSALDSS